MLSGEKALVLSYFSVHVEIDLVKSVLFFLQMFIRCYHVVPSQTTPPPTRKFQLPDIIWSLLIIVAMVTPFISQLLVLERKMFTAFVHFLCLDAFFLSVPPPLSLYWGCRM